MYHWIIYNENGSHCFLSNENFYWNMHVTHNPITSWRVITLMYVKSTCKSIWDSSHTMRCIQNAKCNFNVFNALKNKHSRSTNDLINKRKIFFSFERYAIYIQQIQKDTDLSSMWTPITWFKLIECWNGSNCVKSHALHINVFSVFVARLVENHFDELNISNDNSSSITYYLLDLLFHLFVVKFNHQNISICMQIGKIAMFAMFVSLVALGTESMICLNECNTYTYSTVNSDVIRGELVSLFLFEISLAPNLADIFPFGIGIGTFDMTQNVSVKFGRCGH